MRHTLKYLIILFIVVLANNSFAFEGQTIYYTDIDGLPLNIVKCTTQDVFGYTWIGTINGIANFDGYTFLNYEELEGLNINAISIDKENAIWTATDNGIYCLNRTTNKFELIQEGYFNNLCSYNGAIYALKFDRLTRFKSKSSSEVLFISNSHLVDLNFSKGHVYISRRDGGIITGKIQNISFSPSDSILFPKIKFSKISVNNEEIWLGSNDGKVFHIEGNQKLSEIPLNNHHKISDIEFTKDRIYIATDGNGIFVLNNKHKQIDHLSKIHRNNQGLSSNSVYDIQITNQQVIWVSTYGGGITILRTGNKWIKNIFPVPGDENSIVAEEGTMSFVDSRGNCWLGTNYGLSIKIKSENKTVNFDAEYTMRHLNGSKFLSACEDSNNCIWTGLYDGYLTQFSYNASGQIQINKTVPSVTRIRKIITYNKEHLLICTDTADKPLFLFNIKTGETIPVKLNTNDNNNSQYL
jgi:ligand-binding sensor domain-containing protein